ncbi:MAG: VWA domain-containing protein [Acidobacteria bacterium]|nr:VWA domain-containing protein [Acidobacteriota bacterium]
MTRLRSVVMLPSLIVCLALVVVADSTARAEAQAARTVYVSVMDGQGAPVPDMKQDEFRVTEDGTPRTITSVERASEPIHYAILIDTTPTFSRAVSDVRAAVKAFCELLLSVDPQTQFSIVDFGGAAMTLQDFTSDLPSIEAALGRLLPKPSESVLNEALVDAAKRMSALPPNSRKVILTINLEPTKDATNIMVRTVAEDIRKSGAIVWSVVLQEGTRRDANREQMLKGMTVNTGGRWVMLQGAGGQSQLGGFLRSIAANSFSQYAVTFTPGEAPPKVTDVTVSREGVAALSMKWSNQ